MAKDHFRSNLFYRLSRYSPRPDRNPEEDFLTEAYACVLRAAPRAADEVLKRLFKDVLRNIMSPSFDVKTQHTCGEGRVDMIFSDKGAVIFQENKVSAPFAPGQIEGYQKAVKDSTAKSGQHPAVVSCSASSLAPKHSMDTCFKHLRWHDIYREMKVELPNVRVEARMIWDQFLVFLESKGMVPFSKLIQDEITAIEIVERMTNELWDLLEQLRSHLQQKYKLCREQENKSGWGQICSDQLGVTGKLWFQPWFEYGNDGVHAILDVRKTLSEPTAFAKVSMLAPRFAVADKECLRVRERFDGGIATEFYGKRGDEQIRLVFSWYEDALKPLVDGGLLT